MVKYIIETRGSAFNTNAYSRLRVFAAHALLTAYGMRMAEHLLNGARPVLVCVLAQRLTVFLWNQSRASLGEEGFSAGNMSLHSTHLRIVFVNPNREVSLCLSGFVKSLVICKKIRL